MEILGRYKNGNYDVTLLSDGTKIRETEDDEFIPDFAESMDIKLTNHCSLGCPYCHEGSTPEGEHGDILNEKFIDTLHSYQEVALGGGDVTSHPDLIPFLRRLKERHIIANITVNQYQLYNGKELIQRLVDEQLIYGLGVSLMVLTDEFIETVLQFPNAVIHVINGVVLPEEIEEMADHNLKLLVLGYKELRRGNSFLQEHLEQVEKNKVWMKEHLWEYVSKFAVVSFDNLAIEQLDIKSRLSDEEWNEFFMGDDSEFTYYIDMVNRQFAKSSTAPFDERYPLMDSCDDMFEKIRKRKHE